MPTAPIMPAPVSPLKQRVAQPGKSISVFASLGLVSLWARLFSFVVPELSITVDEKKFWDSYLRDACLFIQRGLWFSTGICLLYLFGPGPLAKLRAASLNDGQLDAFNIMRYGIYLPSAALLIGVAYSRYYQAYFPLVAQIVVLIHIVVLSALDVMIRQQGYSVAVWIALAIMGIFHAYGLQQGQAIRTAVLALAFYFCSARIGGLQTSQWYFDFSLLVLVLLSGVASQAAHAAAARAQYWASLALAESAQRDGLTQLYNRRAFDERIDLLWNQAARTQTRLVLLMVDIDFFKSYNDAKGHLAGDECLVRVATELARTARRPMDIVARYGGEEFVILLYDVDRATAETTAQTLLKNIAQLTLSHPASTIAKVVTVSIGAACVLSNPQRSYRGLIQLADEALYSAKQQGRNRVMFMDKEYDTMVTGVFQNGMTSSGRAA